jgi:carboxypeptidase C (cathepsin A)
MAIRLLNRLACNKHRLMARVMHPKHLNFPRRLRGAVVLSLLLGGALSATADSAAAPAGQTPPAAADSAASAMAAAPEIVESQHSVEIGGQSIAYTARAGKIRLKDAKGEPTADIFFIAYTRDGAEPEARPLTFSFNGGPGSSSVWLHMGVLGPRRVRLQEDGFALPPPHQLVDNAYSLLDETDLVFIDPVSTGFSRATDPDKAREFHGLEEDVAAVGDFIRRYVAEFARWSSPKFLIGESYGTTRAAALSLHLQERYGMYLNGVMLVSSVLDFATLQFSEDNDLPFVLFLPSMAATAHFHGRLPEPYQSMPVEDLLREAEAFAMGPYRDALFAADSLPRAQVDEVAERLAALTGVPREEFERHRLRLSVFAFFSLLLRDEGLAVGRFDSRYKGVAPLPWEFRIGSGYDPSYAQIYGAYSSGFNDYVRRELNYASDLPYEVLTNVRPWNFGEEFQTRYVNVSRRLREALVMNPFLQVHVCSGIYDLATPYFATDYTLDRLHLHPDLRDNIVTESYAAGHMMYTVKSELARQKAALARFIRRAAAR